MLTQSETKPIKQLADKLYEWASSREPKLPEHIRQGNIVSEQIGRPSFSGSLKKAIDNLPKLVKSVLQSYAPEHLDSFQKDLDDLYRKAGDVDYERSKTGGEANILKCQAQTAAKNFAQELRLVNGIVESLREQIENSKKPEETEQDITPSKRRGTIKKITGWLFKKTSHVIGAIIVAIIGGLIVAILVDIFVDFGWLERIKAVIYKILQLN